MENSMIHYRCVLCYYLENLCLQWLLWWRLQRWWLSWAFTITLLS